MNKPLLTAAALLLLPTLAHAHPGHGVIDFSQGITHPLTGIDHLATMLAVGLWSAHLGKRATLLVPAAFLLMMTAGALLAFTNLHLLFSEHAVEQSIAASLLLLGLLLTFAFRLPTPASMLLVSVFALFHGYAHGAEMHPAASALPYAAGFLLATALLHAAGITLATLFAKRHNLLYTRLAGVGLVATAALLFAGIL